MGAIRTSEFGYLFFDFYFEGQRYREKTTLRDTPRNRSALEKKLGIIEREISLGVFDYLRWFPEGNRAEEFEATEGEAAPIAARDYILQWYETHRKTVKPYTARGLKESIDSRILPWVGDTSIQEISRRMVKDLVGDWLEEGLSVRTIRNYIKPLRQSLEEAVEEGLIPSNPAKNMRLPLAEPTEIDPFTYEEIQAFLEKSTGFYRAYFEMAFLTGLRPSEEIALKRRNVKLEQGKILVRASYVDGHEGPPKTRSAVRDVEILPPLAAVLEEQLKKSRGYDYLFPSQTGGPLELHNIRNRHWYPTLEKADLRRRSMYQTRHTFASLMLSAGEDINWVARMMGDRIDTVLKHYHRYMPDKERQDGAKFLERYGGGQK